MLVSDWKLNTVNDLFDTNLGKMLNQTAKIKNPQYKYLGNSDVKWGRFDFSALKTMHFNEREVIKFTLKVGDILMCEGGEVGRCSIWNTKKENIYYQKALHRLRSKGNIIPEYFYNFMVFIAGTKALQNFTTRTSIAHLTREKLLKIPINTPPLPEQQQIAKILSTWDNAISATERLIDNSKQQKKALMQQLLTGKKRLPSFNQDWIKIPFGDIVKISSKKYNPYKTNKYLPCIELEHIKQDSGQIIGSSNASELASIKNHFSAGSVIFGKLRPYLRKFARPKFDGVCSTEIWVFKTKLQLLDEYLFHFIQTDKFISEANKSAGSKMPRADWGLVSELVIKIPDLSEQQKIAAVLTNADKEIELLNQQLTDLKQEKKALMQQLLTGKRRVIIDSEVA